MTIHAGVRNWEKLLHLPFQSSLPLLSIRNFSSVLQIDVERPATFAGRLLYHSFRNYSCLPALCAYCDNTSTTSQPHISELNPFMPPRLCQLPMQFL
jgi:hypothetical protein